MESRNTEEGSIGGATGSFYIDVKQREKQYSTWLYTDMVGANFNELSLLGFDFGIVKIVSEFFFNPLLPNITLHGDR